MKLITTAVSIAIIATIATVITMSINSCTYPSYAEMNHPYDGMQQNQRMDDAKLNDTLQQLINANYPKSAAINLLVDHYNVLIVGEVDSRGTKSDIITLIKDNPNVKNTWDYTDVTVNTVPKVYLNKSINKKVLKRISEEDNITMDNLQSISVKGVVYLLGNIHEYEIPNLASAIDAMHAIPGVIKIVNLVQVLPD